MNLSVAILWFTSLFLPMPQALMNPQALVTTRAGGDVITLVNVAQGPDSSGMGGSATTTAATTVPATFNLAAGNALFCGVALNSNTAPTLSDVGSANTFTLVTSAAKGSGGKVYLFQVLNAVAVSSEVVTATFASSTFPSIACAQYHRSFGTFTEDVTTTGTSSSAASVTSSAYTTTRAIEVIVAVASLDQGVSAFTATSPFVLEETGNNTTSPTIVPVIGLQDNIVSTIQTSATTTMAYTMGSLGNWGICVVSIY